MLRRPPIFTLFPYTTLFRSDNGRVLVRLPVRVLRLNDAVIWAAPVELFCEIAIDVRSRSPYPNTLYFGYTKDRKSTRLNSSHVRISYAVFCLKKKTTKVSSY